MMDQAGVLRTSVFALAAVFAATVLAEKETPPAAAAEGTPAAQEQTPQLGKIFEPLARVMFIQGVCEVNNPDVGEFKPAIENKAYPFGSVFRTGPGSSAILALSSQETVQLFDSTEVTVLIPKKNPDGRTIRFASGKINTNLRDNLPEGCFAIETSNATCKNIMGRGEYILSAENNTEMFQAKTVTGSARVEGPQYRIPALRAANAINVLTAADHSFSRLTSVSGDFPIVLEKGSEDAITYGMSPKAVVKIWREKAPVGGRMIISTLIVSPTGIARHRFAYAEGRPSIATGELVNQTEEAKKDDLPVLLSTPDQAQVQNVAAEKPEQDVDKEKKKDQ